MNAKSNIAVIGAGVVGLSCALWLQKKGFDVTLIDPEHPGSGTSSGNACTIATYGCVPVNSPDLLRRLPRLLFSGDSPLSLDFGYLLRHPGWALDFLQNCRQLGKLLAATWDGLDPLLDMAEARDLIASNGFMHVYVDQGEFDAAWPANQARRAQGAEFTELDRGDIEALEPGLKKPSPAGCCSTTSVTCSTRSN